MHYCADCIHRFEKSKLEGGGLECRANPPTPFLVPQPGGAALMSAFPPVNPNMTCALFEADIADETPQETADPTKGN